MSVATEQKGVTTEVAEKILMLQPRCIICGGTFDTHIHHRVFKSEGEIGVANLLSEKKEIYKNCYSRDLESLWGLNDIQNLCVLCRNCHEGSRGVHGGNEVLRQKLRNSFTSPITGFSVPFYQDKLPY
jgi:5-methylcytosine-specific restriction endonuclease McrA